MSEPYASYTRDDYDAALVSFAFAGKDERISG